MSELTPPKWTNRSVLDFAHGADPLERAHAVASQLTVLAREHGVAGPPVDVFGLATALRIQLRPMDDLLDARISKLDSEDLVIEYNPSRPRGRLRFSIAHEIAHSRFHDVAERTRHRTAAGSISDIDDDDWELELVCDVIAADLLIPEHAIEGLLTVDPDIDFIMETRKKWDVSTEALLRRLVDTTPRSLTMLATSRPSHRLPGTLRVDYAINSASAHASGPLALISHGDVLHEADPLLRCTAVGQTVRGQLNIGGEMLFAQCVGVPAYPGSKWPRVLALVEAEDQRLAMPNLEFVVSDLVDIPPSQTPVIFAHVVSDSVRTWSHVGAAGTLAKQFPDFAQAFRAWTIASPDNLALGNVHYVERPIEGRDVGVASLIVQEGFGGGAPRLRYDALEKALLALSNLAGSRGAEIHVPRLGAGQAGGRWDEVQRQLVSFLAARGTKVVVHTKPAANRPNRKNND